MTNIYSLILKLHLSIFVKKYKETNNLQKYNYQCLTHIWIALIFCSPVPIDFGINTAHLWVSNTAHLLHRPLIIIFYNTRCETNLKAITHNDLWVCGKLLTLKVSKLQNGMYMIQPILQCPPYIKIKRKMRQE